MTKLQATKIIQTYYTGGHFKNSLLKTIQNADKSNLSALYKAYPKLVIAQCIYIGLKYPSQLNDL